MWKAMEKRLGAKPSPASWILSRYCWQTPVKWLRSLYLFYTCFCFSALSLSADASESRCQQGKTQFGVGLRSGGENHLRLLEGTPSLQSCWAACCQDSACYAFWWLEGMCIQADCSRPQSCRAFRTDSSNSVLVFLKKFQTANDLGFPPEDDVPHLLGLGWSRASWRRQSPTRAPVIPAVSSSDQQSLIRKLQKRESPSEEVFAPVVTQRFIKNDSKELGGLNTSDSAEVHKAVTISSHLTTDLTAEIPEWPKNISVQPETLEDPDSIPSTQQVKSPGKTQIATTLPVAPSSSYVTPTPQASFQSPSVSYPVVKELVVSAGESVQITLPKNEVQLNAYVLQEPLKGETYTYKWQLITHPKDYSGEMEGKHSRILKLSKLTPGLYEFRVMVDGLNSHGEGYVNVTVKPEPRKNRPPVAIVSPQFQEISLPTTSTVIDGSQSTDDDKIVQYHWEELKGPLREEKISGDTAILKLSKLVPGNYTFSLTVVDSDGATSSTTASLTVNKAVDYPPVANAGPNQVITLPQNSITLFGNQSTDDHGITSYEWSLSPSSKGKVVEMQGVRTPTLQLSAMQEGDYTYQLTVTDTIGQQATAQVTVIVQPENNKPPQADAGPDKELTLPVDSTTLDGSKSSDDQKIISYLWEKTQGPDGVQLENANSSVATVTGLQVGAYVFTLTVKDERNLQSQSSVNVIVKEEMNKPPIAKITGSVVITLPTNTAELDGSKSSDDKGIVSYLWTRDDGSPAAGEVLNHSDHHPILFLSNLVEGTYTFHLKVTDAKGESDTDRTTVEVKPDPRKNNLVEIILDVNVSQLTERLKGMFIRQIGVLLGVLDSDIIVQKIQPYTEQSTKMVFFVQNEPPHQIFKGHEVAAILKSELRKQKAEFLVFGALEINTVTCQLNCSDHGHCDSFTKRCVCDPFWMENFIKVQLRDGDSNCEWSVLYVIIASFIIVVALGILSWTMICCCKRQKGKPKRKSKYKILDATDQESLELKPTFRAGIKQKGPMLSSSLMHSESELDSDDAIFTWPDREKGKLLLGQNGSVPNGQTPLKARNPREEIL
ncbi:dyslexia-associated protein KIAA0319-like protein homolog isoform X1 [Trichechus manatus latirostris]|uniref:Dyslexia-associated protein KIAA0319-like protein homolog isoform X1 n=2 Tax=Trichechus manatus latirostris TaxID=127582 RepID=A0A2Y9QUQ2_TRIMA|nr:dyslexia-associated protein KIAA0319-like protein homolog isoform X1 [Trichechus manatus latirostris]XP_023583011.1 dyslexia-associated protein KIAA0319-like protein homolog isoform X1 [Trichechus manatus latirostris]XP_023583012.1 dyslexia-associated protein KIAA0319-like protein homolog isoform X1 [Trichechus manatus latirostris]XP_023583013.1 dyslexia-associated protein KIAA0319-like protein homolog isoform X1 [Trichechus manatus latirostris]XP_023583014.1 dyslexia-associated protein KIAA